MKKKLIFLSVVVLIIASGILVISAAAQDYTNGTDVTETEGYYTSGTDVAEEEGYYTGGTDVTEEGYYTGGTDVTEEGYYASGTDVTEEESIRSLLEAEGFRFSPCGNYAFSPGLTESCAHVYVPDEEGNLVPLTENYIYFQLLDCGEIIKTTLTPYGMVYMDSISSYEFFEYRDYVYGFDEIRGTCAPGTHTWGPWQSTNPSWCFRNCTRCGYRHIHTVNGIQGHGVSRARDLNVSSHEIRCSQCNRLHATAPHTWGNWVQISPTQLRGTCIANFGGCGRTTIVLLSR